MPVPHKYTGVSYNYKIIAKKSLKHAFLSI